MMIAKGYINQGVGYVPSLTLFNRKQWSAFLTFSKHYSEVVRSMSFAHDKLEIRSVGYEWDKWSDNIRNAFREGLVFSFLRHPLIRFTMVFGDSNPHRASERIDYITSVYDDRTSSLLLREDFVGLPCIANKRYLTSTNRAHHASHLAAYKEVSKRDFWSTDSIIEWGGGYGDMARIIKKANPKVTYTIIDLPELLGIQYVYLSSLGIEVNMINTENDEIKNGVINLIASSFLLSSKYKVTAQSFLSTWAISECPKYLQQFVSNEALFSAQNILIASKIDANNSLPTLIDPSLFIKENVPFLGDKHEYWIA